MDKNTLIYIAIAVVFLILLYIVYLQISNLMDTQGKEPVIIREVRNGKIPQQISGDRIKSPDDAFSYSYNVWLNIQDITYKQNEWKHIFHKGYLDGSDSQPGIWLSPDKNNIEIRLTTYKTPNTFNVIDTPTNVLALTELSYTNLVNNEEIGDTYQEILEKNTNYENIIMFMYKNDSNTDLSTRIPVQYMLIDGSIEDNDLYSSMEVSEKLDVITLEKTDETKSVNPNVSKFSEKVGLSAIVENYPIKKWFLLSIVTGENSLDIYIDGNLYKTTALNGFVKENDGDLFINLSGGFGGWITQLQYFNRPLVPWELRDTYLKGPNGYLIPDIYSMFNSFDQRIQFDTIPVEEEDLTSCSIATTCQPCSSSTTTTDSGTDDDSDDDDDSD